MSWPWLQPHTSLTENYYYPESTKPHENSILSETTDRTTELTLQYLHSPSILALPDEFYPKKVFNNTSVPTFKSNLALFSPQHNFQLTATESFQSPQTSIKTETETDFKHFLPLQIEDLSLQTSPATTILCVEYLEQNPFIIPHFGMCSTLTFYYPAPIFLEKEEKDHPDFHTQLITQPVRKNTDTPFLGHLPLNASVTALENNMSICPVQLHQFPILQHNQVQPYLMVRTSGSSTWTIQKVKQMYTAGQLEPKIKVYTPESPKYNELTSKIIQHWIHRRFHRASQKYYRPWITQAAITRVFGTLSDTLIKTYLMSIAELKKMTDERVGFWVLKKDALLLTLEQLHALVTPEDMCIYYSINQGQAQLIKRGIKVWIDAKMWSKYLDHFDDRNQSKNKQDKWRLNSDRMYRIAVYIEKWLQFSPWNMTENFENAKRGKGVIFQIKGRGSPFGNTRSYSYLTESCSRFKIKHFYPEIETPNIKSRKETNQTSADIRTILITDLKKNLINLGVSLEDIPTERWKMANKMETIVREKIIDGTLFLVQDYKKYQKYARQIKLTDKQLQEVIQVQLNKKWKNNSLC